MLRGQRGQAEGRERPPRVSRWDGARASTSGSRNLGILAARADTPWRRRPAQTSPRPAPAAQGGGPAQRPPRRRSRGRRREYGPGWSQERSSPRSGPLGQRRQPQTARGHALLLTAPDPQLQLGLVQVLHIVPQEAVQQVRDHRLQHHGGLRRGRGRTWNRPAQLRAATSAANDSTPRAPTRPRGAPHRA